MGELVLNKYPVLVSVPMEGCSSHIQAFHLKD